MCRIALCCLFLLACSGEFDISHTDEFSEEPAQDGIPEDTPLPPPIFSLPQAGFYSSLTLPPPVPENGGIVRCTFDGSEPTESTPATTDSTSITHSTIVSCYEFLQDEVIAKATESYFIGETSSMPIFSIRVSPDYLQDYLDGEPCSPDPCLSAKFWEDVEYPVHVEFFPQGSLSEGKVFEIDAGISITGGGSRNQKKKSVAIKMRKEYQKGRLNYPLFPTMPEVKKFKSFLLRNNGNRYSNDYVVDAAGTSLVGEIGLDYQRSRHVVVFYNGKYYGIYDLREKLNEHYIESHHGIDSKDINLIEHIHDRIEIKNGSDESYRELLEFASNNDLSSDNKAYEEIQKKLDINSFANYMAAEIYYRNGDWTDNNVKAWSSSNTPWKFIMYDVDHGFDYSLGHAAFFSMTMFDWIRLGGMNACKNNPSPNCFNNLFINLISNSDFKRLFINHAAIIYHDYINANTMIVQIDRRLQHIPQKEIERDLRELPRDPNIFNSCGITFDTYSACTRNWVFNRDKSVREEFRNEFDLGKDAPIEIIAEGNGHILVDGMPLPNKAYAGTFFSNNDLMLAAVPEEGASFVKWSDGNTDNPRLFKAEPYSTYKAFFK